MRLIICATGNGLLCARDGVLWERISYVCASSDHVYKEQWQLWLKPTHYYTLLTFVYLFLRAVIFNTFYSDLIQFTLKTIINIYFYKIFQFKSLCL